MKNKRFLNILKMQVLPLFSNVKERDKGNEFTQTSLLASLVPTTCLIIGQCFLIVGTLKFLNW